MPVHACLCCGLGVRGGGGGVEVQPHSTGANAKSECFCLPAVCVAKVPQDARPLQSGNGRNAGRLGGGVSQPGLLLCPRLCKWGVAMFLREGTGGRACEARSLGA